MQTQSTPCPSRSDKAPPSKKIDGDFAEHGAAVPRTPAMGTPDDAAGMFAVLGAFAEAGHLTTADKDRCRERLARLGVDETTPLTLTEIRARAAEALSVARATAIPVAQYAALGASLAAGSSHPPLKRPRMEGLNTGFS